MCGSWSASSLSLSPLILALCWWVLGQFRLQRNCGLAEKEEKCCCIVTEQSRAHNQCCERDRLTRSHAESSSECHRLVSSSSIDNESFGKNQGPHSCFIPCWQNIVVPSEVITKTLIIELAQRRALRATIA